jgi:PAS domain S-box-containing protein
LAIELVGVALAYFILAKLGLMLASVHPSATPIWPPTGLALAAVLLWGPRIWPAIFVAALAANATTAGTIASSAAIACGNTLEALVGGYLVRRWSNGRSTFDTPTGVARFALIGLAATPVSASIGVSSLSLAGQAPWADLAAIWMTWWLGDLAGALVVTPVIVLWSGGAAWTHRRDDITESAAILVATIIIGLVAFSPLIDQTPGREPLGFLAIVPLLWAALRRGQPDTALAALVLAGFAIWGTLAGSGPFARPNLNDSFLLLVMFVISISVPSLALSANLALRKQTEQTLREARDALSQTVEQRTAQLAVATNALQVEQKKLAEAETAHDVIERRKTKRALMQSETQFRMLVEGVSDYAIYMLSPQGLVSSWNSGAQRIKGYAATDIIGAHFSRFYTEEDRSRGAPDRALATAVAEGKYEAEGWRVRKDGSRFWASVVIDAIRDESGTLIGFAKITRDFTERREAQTALEQTRDQLMQAQKMEALGQLTGGIAHDFNNLLMIVSGHAQILQRRLALEPKAQQALENIQAAARRGESLTRQLLTFARRQRLNPVVLDLRERVEAMSHMLASSLRGNIKQTYDTSAEVWPVEVDLAEFELALVNIAVNARDAMPDGGTFALLIRNVTLMRSANVGDLEGDFVAIALSDTGVGMPPEVTARIFEPFFTTKAVGKGTGLGLSQVNGFAHQSGGAVTVTSTVGRGTTVTIFLPRSRAAASAVRPEPAAQPAAHGGGTILVVEDSPEVAEVTIGLLQQLGYRTLHAENAREALERLRSAGPVDLVFSDIVMPGGMNGIDLAEEVKRRHPDIPVLLASGYSEAVQGAQTRFEILRKPFEISTLDKALREALARRAA